MENLDAMVTTFQLDADELDLAILKSIKKAFKGRKIEIIISDTQKSAADDLLKRIENLKKNKNTIQFSQKNFFKTYRNKISNASN